MIQPNGNDFGHGDANITLDMLFPEQVENNPSLHYTTPQFGLSGNPAVTENIQEEALTALAFDMDPQASKRGVQKDSGMLPEINISDTFAEHVSFTNRDHDDQAAASTVLPSLPKRPTATLG